MLIKFGTSVGLAICNVYCLSSSFNLMFLLAMYPQKLRQKSVFYSQSYPPQNSSEKFPKIHRKTREPGNFNFIKPFVPNALFIYLLNTSENLTVFWCFQGVEKECIGSEWVKKRLVFSCEFCRIWRTACI